LGLGLALISLAASDDKITWEKPEAALAKSTATGKPVLWYFINNQYMKDAAGAAPNALAGAETGRLDQAFTNPVILKRKDNFIWVRADQGLSNKFKVTNAPMVIFTDGDGEMIHKAPVTNPEQLYDAMQTVQKEKYVNVPVKWGDVVRTGPIKKKLLVVGFDDPKTESLKVLEDRTLVKYHANCEFVKLPYEKDGEAAKRWGVQQPPAIIVCDAMENILERLAGKKQPIEVKVAILKAVHKLEEQDKASRK
jgi:thioredoxin-related protein